MGKSLIKTVEKAGLKINEEKMKKKWRKNEVHNG